jgi:FMN-dependent NADH-azoreductase
LADKPVFLLMASGGVEIGGGADFASAYLRYVLGFIGLKDVRLAAAERLNITAEQGEAAALAKIAHLSLDIRPLNEARVA